MYRYRYGIGLHNEKAFASCNVLSCCLIAFNFSYFFGVYDTVLSSLVIANESVIAKIKTENLFPYFVIKSWLQVSEEVPGLPGGVESGGNGRAQVPARGQGATQA
jgi:hypothetical protein